MSEFQNTIAYATYRNDGGEVDNLVAGQYVKIPFTPQEVDGLVKNFGASKPDDFTIQAQQTGAYYVDFSFIAINGDSKNYTLDAFIGGVATSNILLFFQQSTQQKYEVSGSYIFNLTKGDNLGFKIYTETLPSIAFFMKDIKLTIFNLQQLGIH